MFVIKISIFLSMVAFIPVLGPTQPPI